MIADNKIPKLRFKDFKKEWQEDKANNIFMNESIKNHELEKVLAATQNKGIVFRKDLDIDIKFDKSTLRNYKYVVPGNVIISLRSFQGGFEISDKKGIISPAYTVMSFNDDSMNVDYWKQYLKTYKFIQSLKKITFGIRDGRSISFKEFSTLKLKFTDNKSEQKKIGSFLKKIDNIIELQTKKLEQLKKLKRAYLQKMFLQDGESVPRLRFRGISGKWNEGKAKNIFSNQSIKNCAEEEVLASTQNNGVVFRKNLDMDMNFDKSALSNYKLVKSGNVIISLRSFQGGFEVSDKKGIISPAYTVMSFNDDSMNIDYWKQYLKTYNFIQSLKKVTFGIRDGRSISFKEFSSLKLIYPSFNEQKKIGQLFDIMDRIIDLQYQKIENQKNIKKYYLNKMFID